MKKLYGHIIRGLSKALSAIISVLIEILDLIVTAINGIGSYLISFLAAGGCLFILILSPFLAPFLIPIIIVFVIIPLLGRGFINWLRYIHYTAIEFLNDYSNYLLDDSKVSFKSFDDYSKKYRQMQEEQARKEREERRRQEQEAWEQRFREFYEQMNQNASRGGYYQQGGYYQPGGSHQGYQQTYQNPYSDFIRQYKEACQTLGVSETADKYEIKLQYRKLAKKYHPDISKEPNATEKFQEINAAYDFLSDENIARYQQMQKK